MDLSGFFLEQVSAGVEFPIGRDEFVVRSLKLPGEFVMFCGEGREAGVECRAFCFELGDAFGLLVDLSGFFLEQVSAGVQFFLRCG